MGHEPLRLHEPVSDRSRSKRWPGALMWFWLSVVFGLIGFLVIWKRLDPGVDLETALMVLIVSPFALAIGSVLVCMVITHVFGPKDPAYPRSDGLSFGSAASIFFGSLLGSILAMLGMMGGA
jgi:hypothetical protein